ncbi:hypothetical protein BKP45_21080 [Anaerobacillus alkalidiazotrophicus]|uniref:Uncharacterized protein n=1 Tax=Anaerobacillus alkalidiazotrophicus TaxID=472963 RepID=A0A1S2LWG5_9BACI|nr:hypothetical protein [Anaerobacillus alkalidiazotrophicus]OIJ16503.1 hypothetical protein BKP45_21080 [Anaerobacillus alkalidiazotrophicus]
MCVLEAVLTYYPNSAGERKSQIIIGKTENIRMLRLLRDHIISEAKDEIVMWETIDQGVATDCKADLQKLISILSMLIPEVDLQPELKSIKGGKSEDYS